MSEKKFKIVWEKFQHRAGSICSKLDSTLVLLGIFMAWHCGLALILFFALLQRSIGKIFGQKLTNNRVFHSSRIKCILIRLRVFKLWCVSTVKDKQDFDKGASLNHVEQFLDKFDPPPCGPFY